MRGLNIPAVRFRNRWPMTRREGLCFGSLCGLALVSGPGRAMTAWPAAERATFGCAKRCVLIWLDGGPSHLEMFDPKPEAPAEVRGPLKTIATKVPGLAFTEGLPQLAARADRLTVVRSMTSPVGEHNLATQYALSGHIPGGRSPAPAFMLSAAELLRATEPLPRHIAVPDFQLGGGSQLLGSFPQSHLPWSLAHDANEPRLADAVLPSANMDVARLQRRQELLSAKPLLGMETSQLEQAISLLTDSSVRHAFDLDQESVQTRQRYGNKPIGQNSLLARRLLERGVPIVTINNKGWDTHERLHERLQAGFAGAAQPVGLIPSLDRAVSALLDDLASSGLLDETLVVVMGEFGRTPKINAQRGRDHWARAYSVMLAGAGVKPGYCHGSSDRTGESVTNAPVSPAELVATLYHLLGLDPEHHTATPDGQQLRRVAVGANVVRDLLV